jgi:hypothetical protein
MAAPAGSGALPPQLARVERLPPAGPALELVEALVGVAAPLLALLAGEAAEMVTPQAERLPLVVIPAAAAPLRAAEAVVVELPVAEQVLMLE